MSESFLGVGGRMKAAQINEYGGPEVIHINEAPEPQVTARHVLIDVYSSSLNPCDTSLREGRMKEAMSLQLPVTLGGDVAGVVVSVGCDEDTLVPGDKVYGQANVVAGNSGAFAEL